MSARHDIPSGARLRVLSASGRVNVIAEDREDLEVDPPERHVEYKHDDGVIEVKSRSGSLSLRCPTGTNVSVGVMSGGVSLEGEFGSVKISTVSGSVAVDSAKGDVDVRSVSGSIEVGECGGSCKLSSKSGRVSIGRVEHAARISTMSGSVEIGTAGEEEVDVRTISGRIAVRVAEGRQPRVRLRTISGRVRCDCPQGSDFDVKASSISGVLEITGESA